MVKPWFRDWVVKLKQRVPRDDWPPYESAYWDDIQHTLIRCGCPDEEAADEAVSRLRLDGFPFPNSLDKPLAEVVRAIIAERSAEQAGATDLGTARHASRLCDDCEGNGLATRFRRKSLGTDRGDRIVLFCRCPFGRALKANHSAEMHDAIPATHSIPDLEDYPFLWGDECRYPAPPGVVAEVVARKQAEAEAEAVRDPVERERLRTLAALRARVAADRESDRSARVDKGVRRLFGGANPFMETSPQPEARPQAPPREGAPF